MSESKETQTNNDLIKQRIRERYKGLSEDALDVIPANPHEDFYKSDTKKRVAVYARVSTDDPNQTSSYELQKNHYEDMVNRRPSLLLSEHADAIIEKSFLGETGSVYSNDPERDLVTTPQQAATQIIGILNRMVAEILE